jgi:hypothetical protein
MTGYKSSDLRYECVRDGCFIDTLPNWDWMKGCFPRGIMPTDVDGMVEINGHTLFIEQKRSGASLDGGQRLAFRRLTEDPRITVLFLRATESAEHYECLIYDVDEPAGWQRWSVDFIRAWLQNWSIQVADTGRAS